ncbi:aldehyde dehydrogenase [Nocardia barduliensis]|uniref:aldehyde dehydrogenase n=1 Tax=Nocardia barduliensis TaxID=2736643 RepID=UPI001572223D|nr:aldehyde dehydrogenase [Nocardia barduliensis]
MSNYDRLFVGGQWRAPSSDRTLEVVSPHTETVIARLAAPAHADVDAAVAAARDAFDHGPWRHSSVAERVAAVRDLAERYTAREPELAELVTAEMGAPLRFSRSAHVRLPGVMMRALADVAANFVWEETRPGYLGADVLVCHEPVGVVAAIVPWNMPVFLTVAKLIPALLAGCTVVLKPSPETPLDAYLMAELLMDSAIPPGVVSIVPGDGELGAYLVAHPGVDKASFTGSTAAGRRVAVACAQALRRVSLELGGKSAAVVLDDADPEQVAIGAQVAALMNGGQACVAQTRILVPRNRYREYVSALSEMVWRLRVGDPADEATDIGPLVSARQRDRVHGYLETGLREGARAVVGGTGTPPGCDRGWYVRPTLFTDVDPGMRIAREEIFGPVVTVLAYDGDDEAVALADATEYGLSGSVWSADPERALAVARRIRSGTVGINQAYSMDPVAPFGGVKASGIGREFGREGLADYLTTKSVSGR